jgi:cell division septation protein DedD
VVQPERPAPVAKAAGAPPASTATSLVPAAKYWVQLGAFKTLEAARLLASTLHPQTAIISSGPGPGAGATALNRVRIGPFAELAQAAAKLRELDHRGYPGFIALTQD